MVSAALVAAVVLSALASLEACAPAEAPEQVEATLELEQPTRRLIQLGLQAEGFDPGPPDGLFGRRTRSAIRGWQESQGLSPTGFLDGSAAEALRAAGAARRSAAGTKAASTSLETAARVDETPAGNAPAAAEEPSVGGAPAAPEPSGDLTAWVRAVDGSLTDAEGAAAQAEAAATGAGGWFLRTMACLDAEERMLRALDRVRSLTTGEGRPEGVAPATGNEVYVELGERMAAAREQVRTACEFIEPPR